MTIDSYEVGGLMSSGLSTAVLDSLPDATAMVDEAGRIVSVNHAWRRFAMDNGGRPETTGVGVDYLAVCRRAAEAGCTDAVKVADGLRAVLADETVQSELEYPCPSPAVGRWFLLRTTRLAGPVSGAVVSHVNITRRKAAEEVVAHQAAHDPMTGLANRRLFGTRLDVALGRRGGVQTLGVLFLNLDGFKAVNDTYGHDAGTRSCSRRRTGCRPSSNRRTASRGWAVTSSRSSPAARQPRRSGSCASWSPRCSRYRTWSTATC